MENKAKFNTERNDLYSSFKPETKERTKLRLNEMLFHGMEEVGYGEFGIKGLVSGLYIENVWHFSDTEFNDYMNFVKDSILENELNKK
jgi:hypothetical protein